MEPKQAVAAAKAHFVEAFAEEPSLEEIWFEDTPGGGAWCVTLGIRERMQSGSPFGIQFKHVKDYKVVRILDKDGSLVSIRNREGGRAA